jgi:hypothetical protein
MTWKGLAALLRLFLGALLATGAIYLCGWACRELIGYKVVSHVYDPKELIRFLQAHFPESGTYTVPDPSDDDEAIEELFETGPVATLHVLSPTDIFLKKRWSLIRIGQTFLVALLIGWILRKSRPAIESYRSRVVFIALIGLAAALYNDTADLIWVYHPWPWAIAKGFSHIASWTIAGLILASDWFIGLEKNSTESRK